MRKIADSGLCEISLARDEKARKLLDELGFKNTEIILDPAFFNYPISQKNRNLSILTWKNLDYQYYNAYFFEKIKLIYKRPIESSKRILTRLLKSNLRKRRISAYNQYLVDQFYIMEEPKLVIVHESHEIRPAQKLFGPDKVYYSADYRDIFFKYSQARLNIGSRIHGAIPSLLHGAPIKVIYENNKATTLSEAKRIFESNTKKLNKYINVYFLNSTTPDVQPPKTTDTDDIQRIINQEKVKIQNLLQGTKILSKLLDL